MVPDRNNTSTLGWRGNGTAVFDGSLVVVGDVDFSGNPATLQVTYAQLDYTVETAPTMWLSQ